MSLRCRVDDMVKVIPPNEGAGLIGRVEAYAHGTSREYGLPFWIVRFPHEVQTLRGDWSRVLSNGAVVADMCLEPIRPPETPVVETHDIEVAA